ncbi:hypothetical protein Dsin_011472 [Dipteronia sinensis]|uniref:RIN4 pathogenic type III effector avirulence factor Avr cleavage site domain-containing protein n=1 Tax=Dipteronia sinensis TaxID=43782 RepID=A0AAE0AUP2_9ROSI|nr:hypothetical protein Dsin_011472 [Dipteronia sinensis]
MSSLPKFGEWDVNNPASAEGFSVIFAKASDEKRAGSSHHRQYEKGNVSSQRRYDSSKRIFDKNDKNNYSVKRLFCCAFIVPKK